MKRALLLWGVLLCTLPLQAQTVWKLATGYRSESFHTQNIVQFARDVGQATQGGLTIEVHPDNRLFKLREIEPAVRAGKAQAGEIIMTNLVADIPIAGADTIPFVVGGYADAKRLWDLQRPLLERHMAKRGLTVLYAVPWPAQGLYSVGPLRVASDLKGKKMRTYNQSTQRLAELLGAVPVDVAMVDVDKALARGDIDSMVTSALTGVENKVWGRIRHYYEVNAWLPKNMVFVQTEAFEQLPATTREAVLAAARTAEARGWRMSEDVANETTRELERQGMKVERLPAEFERQLKRVGERLSSEWVRSVGNEANQIFVPYYFQR
jgi:TRAP-type C4-dicarboxylate transport system substrate-binding protein